MEGGVISTLKNKKLAIGICNSQEKIDSDFFWSFVHIKHVCPTMLLKRATHPWDIIRNNQLIKAFLESDCDYFVKMDVDQWYPPDYFEIMVPLLETHDIIGPMIYDRFQASNFMPLCFKPAPEKPLQRGRAYDGRTGIRELPYLHTNCFYNRYVLEALVQPWYEAHFSDDGLKRANHVDYTFMQKFTDLGYKIYINFDVVVEHLAQVSLSRKFYEQWNRDSQGC